MGTHVILFDGICNLCNGMVSFIIKRDKKALFRFAAIQSGAGQTLLRHHHIEDDNSTLYYIKGSVCYRKSGAILYILRDLGGIWKCFYPFIFIPACIRDAIYLLISRYRYRLFGKRESCILPTAELRGRFL